MKQPHILFFFPDQWRHDWTGLNPALDIRTPNIERLARRGVTFTDTITPSPVCAPARACLALGVEYDHCPVKANKHDLPLDRVTFYRRLREAGYQTMGCGKFDLHKHTKRWGLDGKTDLEAWGFSDGIDNEGKIDAFIGDRTGKRGPYMHYLEGRGLRTVHDADHEARGGLGTHPTALPEEAYCDNWIGQNGLDLIERAPADQPWFLQVNFTGPHSPWDVTERMWQSVRGRRLPPPVHDTDAADPGILEIRRNYVAMLENIDRWVGLYLEKLAVRGELDNTLVVFSSDHGEMLGDHGQWGKCSWRHASVGVPLIVAGPGVRSGAVCDEPTELLDLSATFLDAGGVPIPGGWDARSLKPVLRGDATHVRDVVTAGLTGQKVDWRMAANRQWKLVRTPTELLLFDRQADPEEATNVAGIHPQAVGELAGWLQE